MRRVSISDRIAASEIGGNRLHRRAQHGSAKLARVAKAIWPHKAAPHLAAAAHCSVRMAKYYLSGQRPWSGSAVQALIREELE